MRTMGAFCATGAVGWGKTRMRPTSPAQSMIVGDLTAPLTSALNWVLALSRSAEAPSVA